MHCLSLMTLSAAQRNNFFSFRNTCKFEVNITIHMEKSKVFPNQTQRLRLGAKHVHVFASKEAKANQCIHGSSFEVVWLLGSLFS